MEYSDFIRPACLPVTDVLRKQNVFRLDMYVVGFGKTETGERSSRKKMVVVRGSRMSTCRKLYSRSIKSTHICAGGEHLSDSCNGDSGGPMYRIDSKTDPYRPYWLLTGIVSYGTTECGKYLTNFKFITSKILNLKVFLGFLEFTQKSLNIFHLFSTIFKSNYADLKVLKALTDHLRLNIKW